VNEALSVLVLALELGPDVGRGHPVDADHSTFRLQVSLDQEGGQTDARGRGH